MPGLRSSFAGGRVQRVEEDRNLTKAEKEKILEVLLSQERVLTLLYDKTFPPRPQSQKAGNGGARGLLGTGSQPIKKGHSKSMKGFKKNSEAETIRQFNYYGQTRLQNLDEHDIEGLEREIDFIIRNSNLGSSPKRGMTQGGDYEFDNIVDINGNRVTSSGYTNSIPMKRNKTAGHGNPRSKKKQALI